MGFMQTVSSRKVHLLERQMIRHIILVVLGIVYYEMNNMAIELLFSKHYLKTHAKSKIRRHFK